MRNALAPSPRADVVSLFETLPSQEPARSRRVVELLDRMAADLRRDEARARSLYADVLGCFATDGNHIGFLQTLAYLCVGLPTVQGKERLRFAVFRFRALRLALGPRRALWLLLVPDLTGPVSHE